MRIRTSHSELELDTIAAWVSGPVRPSRGVDVLNDSRLPSLHAHVSGNLTVVRHIVSQRIEHVVELYVPETRLARTNLAHG